jgi:uncharacterized protein (TIGR03000 family)
VVSYGCYAAPVVHGCVAAAPVSCAGGHLVGSVIIGGGTVIGSTTLGTSSTVVNSTTTTGSSNKDVATAEDDKLKPGTPLSAEEQTQLKEMLDAEKDPTEKKKIEEEFKKDSRVGRKATYEVFKKMKTGKDEVSATATIIVAVPSDAKVKIDGMQTASTSSIRYFESPTLTRGKTYSYTFEAEFQKNGTPVKVSKKVSFQAGKVVRCDLTSAPTGLASK